MIMLGLVAMAVVMAEVFFLARGRPCVRVMAWAAATCSALAMFAPGANDVLIGVAMAATSGTISALLFPPNAPLRSRATIEAPNDHG